MSEVVVTRKFPGGKPGQILPLDDRTSQAVKAGNARLLPAGGELDPEPLGDQVEVGRMHGTGHTHDRDEDTHEDWEVRLDAAETAEAAQPPSGEDG